MNFNLNGLFSLEKILSSKSLVNSLSKMLVKKIVSFMNEQNFSIAKIWIIEGKIELVGRVGNDFQIITEDELLKIIDLPIGSYIEKVRNSFSEPTERDFLTIKVELNQDEKQDIFYNIVQDSKVVKNGFLSLDGPAFILENGKEISSVQNEISEQKPPTLSE